MQRAPGMPQVKSLVMDKDLRAIPGNHGRTLIKKKIVSV
jgi:hypothetical protein